MFTQVHKWNIEYITKSPLHVGGEGEEILVAHDGRPMIPGTTLAGVCRAYVEKSSYHNLIDLLFGSQEQQDPHKGLIFFDSICQSTYEYDLRQSVGINGKTRTGKNNQLFTRMFVEKGTVFSTKLILKVPKNDHEQAFQAVKHMLQAINDGLIRIGAHRSIGAGQVKIKRCRHVHYDCSDINDLHAYVNESKPMDDFTLESLKDISSSIRFTVSGKTATPLLIAGQALQRSDKADTSFVRLKDRDGLKDVPYIPGSSLKGVLRHRIERITNILALEKKENHTEQLFGSTENAGELRFRDTIIENYKKKTYYRTSIDPLTGGAKAGALLNEETVEGNMNIVFDYMIDQLNEEVYINLGLLLFALRDLALKKFSLGSRSSIGYGFIDVTSIQMEYNNERLFIDIANQIVDDPKKWLKKIDQHMKRSQEVVQS